MIMEFTNPEEGYEPILSCPECGSTNIRVYGDSPTGKKCCCLRCDKRFVILK